MLKNSKNIKKRIVLSGITNKNVPKTHFKIKNDILYHINS